MSLKDIQAHLTKAQEQLDWHMEQEQQSVAEREARGEKVRYYIFEYEHGECGTGRQDIYAYGLEDAFRRFGWVMDEFKMHPRNINYKMLGEQLSVQAVSVVPDMPEEQE